MIDNTDVPDLKPGHLVRLRHAAPYIVAAVLFVLGLYALHRLLAHVNLHQVAAQIRATPWYVIGLALLSTLAGYLCLAGYDWAALRYIGKALPVPVVLTGGLMAYAFGNTIGLTAISGGAVRWRLYSGLGLDGYDIAKISTFTALSFGVMTTIVGLAAAALHPDALSTVLALSADNIRLLAVVGIILIVVPIAWTSASGRQISIGRFTVRAPSLSVLASQIPVSIGDVTFSALTLYLLLPVADFGFFTFLAVFAAATMAGVISHVPGGIGIFESVIIAALPPGGPVGQIAAALLLYRLIYYLIPFALALILLSLYEAWRAFGGQVSQSPAGRALSAIEPALRAVSPLAPLLLAVMTFGSGLWMSVSALLPSIPRDADAAEALFPLAFVEGSALLSSALGAALIILSLSVVRRSRGAFWLVIGAMAIGCGVALTPPRDVEQAGTLALAILILLPFRHVFRKRSILTHAAMTPGWASLLFAAVAGFGFALFFAQKSTPYANELWWQFAGNEQAPRALRAGLLSSLVLGLGGLTLLLRAPRIRPGPPAPADIEDAARIIAMSDDPDAMFALTGDKSIMFSDDRRAFVMFAASGGSWISYGGPVGAPYAAEEAAFSFVDAARRAAVAPVFYEIGVRTVPLMLDLGMTLHKMGEEGVIDLPNFSLEGSSRKRLRTAYARALRDGLTLQITDPPHDPGLIETIKTISDDWLATKGAREKGFSVGRFERSWLDRCPLALVRHEGRIVAFANVLTTDTHSRVTIDLMRHSGAAPSNTMEFLFTALILALKDRGFGEFSLGMAPLSGMDPTRTRRLWDRFGALIYRHGGGFYNFAGLRTFKEKFDPDWRPRYLATATALPPVMPLADAARLIARKAAPPTAAPTTAAE